jgi:hypothetical protein
MRVQPDYYHLAENEEQKVGPDLPRLIVRLSLRMG